MEEPRIEKFQFDEITSAGLRWKTYSKRFQNMLKAFEIKKDAKKTALLLHYGGEHLFEIFNSFPAEETEDKQFEDILKMFDKYFNPKINVEYQIYLFRKAAQERDEPIDKFSARLRQLAASCNFNDTNREIKTQIIHNCWSQQLRRKALREEMSLEDILAAGRSLEIADKNASDMERKVTESEGVTTINKTKTLTCFKCGGKFPHENKCPAIGKKCRNCDNWNHFEKVCKKSKGTVKAIDQHGDDKNEDSEEYTYGI